VPARLFQFSPSSSFSGWPRILSRRGSAANSATSRPTAVDRLDCHQALARPRRSLGEGGLLAASILPVCALLALPGGRLDAHSDQPIPDRVLRLRHAQKRSRRLRRLPSLADQERCLRAGRSAQPRTIAHGSERPTAGGRLRIGSRARRMVAVGGASRTVERPTQCLPAISVLVRSLQ
jgi:hypothetical protein